MNESTPRNRALGRALVRAVERSQMTQHSLAWKTGIDSPTISRFVGGMRAPTAHQCGVIIGAISAQNGPRSPITQDLAHAIASFHDFARGRQWAAADPESVRMQRSALRAELGSAESAIVICPFTLAPFLTTADPDDVHIRQSGTRRSLTVVIGEPTACATSLVDTRAQITAMSYAEHADVSIHFIEPSLVWNHQIGYNLTVMTTKKGQVIAHIDTQEAGVFFHRPEDVLPLQERAQALATSAVASTNYGAILADSAAASADPAIPRLR